MDISISKNNEECIVKIMGTINESEGDTLKKAFDDAVKVDILKSRSAAKNASFMLLYGQNPSFKTTLAQKSFQQDIQAMPYDDSEYVGHEHYLTNSTPPECPLCPPSVDL